MKKIVVGILIGAALAFSGQVVAENISNVGEKIDKEVSLRLDGNEVGTAVIVNGKSYSEVRKVAESLGLSVSYNENGIDLNSYLSDESVIERIKSLNVQKSQIEKQIDKYNKSIINIQTVLIPKDQKEFDAETNEFLRSKLQISIDNWNKNIEFNQSKIVDLQSQLATIDQQLSELEAQQ